MAAADPIEFPGAWLSVLMPRRSGRRASVYPIDAASFAQFEGRLQAAQPQIDAILDHPLSDPGFVETARMREPTPASIGMHVALGQHVLGGPPALFADWCVRRLGLAGAVAACLERLAATMIHQPGNGLLGYAIVHHGVLHPSTWKAYVPPIALLEYLRRLLSVADEATWCEAGESAAAYRNGLWVQRLSTAFLFPDRHDWVEADLAARPPDWPPMAVSDLPAASGFARRHVAQYVTNDLSLLVTMIDALEHEATSRIVASLDSYYGDLHSRRVILGVLTHLPSDEAVDAMVSRLSFADVPESFQVASRRWPERAHRMLRSRQDDHFVSAMLAHHLYHFPQLGDATPAGLQAAQIAELPTVLTSPPWTRPRHKAIVLRAPEVAVSLHWTDDEERQLWLDDLWPSFEPTHYDDALLARPGSARFYLGGSEAAVRPKLAEWESEKSSFFLENPRVLVAKYELDAYPPVLRLARAKPQVGAELLLPFLSTDAALLMSKWLATSRQYRGLAEQWFARHGAAGVAPLVPVALGRPGAVAGHATVALLRLPVELVRAAAAQLGAGDAVEQLLRRDPLDLVSGKVPEIPAWLVVELLPPVLTRDRGRMLGLAEVRVLVRLIAMSQLQEPHAGLALIAMSFDGASLAEFVWQLFCEWHFAGRPGTSSWALDALAYFGDAQIATRLGPLVRRWPSDGAAQRAKRGADVLAAMDVPEALQQLSSIARTAKSTPLRKHAAARLDDAAAERGLLPEQLDDLLAPELGLGIEQHAYQGVRYVVELGPDCQLALRSPDGRTLAVLENPSTAEEKGIASTWKRERRAGTRDIGQQVRRLEEAMIMQRRWQARDFAASVVGHPLLGRLARRLVWRVGDQLATIDALGDLVNQHGELVTATGWLQLAHPAISDLTPWRPPDAAFGVTQPFAQVERAVYDGDPSEQWGAVVTAVSLHALVRRGWHWGATGRAATRTAVMRPLGLGQGTVVVRVDPGVSAVRDGSAEPEQTIDSVTLHSPTHGDLAVFGDLSRVTRSELLLDLATLGQADRAAPAAHREP